MSSPGGCLDDDEDDDDDDDADEDDDDDDDELKSRSTSSHTPLPFTRSTSTRCRSESRDQRQHTPPGGVKCGSKLMKQQQPMKRENEHQSLDSNGNSILPYFGMYFSRLYLGVGNRCLTFGRHSQEPRQPMFVGSELKKALLY